MLLDHAYELDDAPRWERFYFITGDTPFSVGARSSTPRAGPPPTPASLDRAGSRCRAGSNNRHSPCRKRRDHDTDSVRLARCSCALAAFPSAAWSAGPLQRYALIVGANAGGGDRPQLRYAVTDAERFARVLVDLGGVSPGNAILLKQPKLRELVEGLDLLSRRVVDARRAGGAQRRPHRDRRLLLRARRRERAAARRRSLLVSDAARSARSDSRRRPHRGPRRLLVRRVHAPEGRPGAAARSWSTNRRTCAAMRS